MKPGLFYFDVSVTAAADGLESEDACRARPSLLCAARRGGAGARAALLLSAEHPQTRRRHPQRDTESLHDHRAVRGNKARRSLNSADRIQERLMTVFTDCDFLHSPAGWWQTDDRDYGPAQPCNPGEFRQRRRLWHSESFGAWFSLTSDVPTVDLLLCLLTLDSFHMTCLIVTFMKRSRVV